MENPDLNLWEMRMPRGVPETHPLFVEWVNDYDKQRRLKFSWNNNEIIMSEQVAYNIAEFILHNHRPVVAFKSPMATAAEAVQKAYSRNEAIHKFSKEGEEP